jgi:hypothetical protein
MFTGDEVTKIYYLADDFCILFDALMKKYSIEDQKAPNKRKYHNELTLFKSEVMLTWLRPCSK